MDSKRSKEIMVFSFTVMTLSGLICYVAHRLDNKNLSILSVLVPSCVALAITAIADKKKGVINLFIKQTVKKAAPKWFLFAFLGIPSVASLAVISALHFDVSQFQLRNTELLPQIIVIALIALGEEYGWRGFLLPRLLEKYSVFHSSIILGLIWGIWHLPAYLIGAGVPLEMDFLVFLSWVILGTLYISWIYYYSGSVLTSILAHFSANAAFNYLYLLPEFTGSMHAFWLFMLYFTVAVSSIYYFYRTDLLQKGPSQ